MINLIALVIVTGLTIACSSGGGPESGSADFGPLPDDPPAPVVTQTTVELTSGRDFECLILTDSGSDSLICRGGPTALYNLDFDTPEWLTFARAPVIESLEIWDDTICLTAEVATRPVARTPGIATYCFGEANMNNYVIFDIVFGGPQYDDSPTVNGSVDAEFHASPFMGGDLTTDVVIFANMLYDTEALVTHETLSCDHVEGVSLTCPNFTIDLEDL